MKRDLPPANRFVDAYATITGNWPAAGIITTINPKSPTIMLDNGRISYD